MKASSSYTTTEQIHSFKCVSCIVMNWENVEHCWLVSVRKFRYNIVVNESDQMEKLPVNNKVGALRSQKSYNVIVVVGWVWLPGLRPLLILFHGLLIVAGLTGIVPLLPLLHLVNRKERQLSSNRNKYLTNLFAKGLTQCPTEWRMDNFPLVTTTVE